MEMIENVSNCNKSERRRNKNDLPYFIVVLVIMHGSILPVTIPPPGNPRDKSSPSGPGVGNCLKRFCPGGRGAGQIDFLVKHVTSLSLLS